MTVHENALLAEFLWYKIGGRAKYVIDAKSKQDIYSALEFIKVNAVEKVFICGLGSNLLFTDDYFDGAVIRIMHGDTEQITQKNASVIEAFSGETLEHVITYAFENGLTGLEWAGGLPGTVGAAVRGNVGAYGGELKDSLLEAEVLVQHATGSYTIQTMTNQDLLFSYRHSLIKENPGKMIVLTATFQLKPSNNEEMQRARATYQQHIQHRRDHHPLEYPNCGSVFKNIRERDKIDKILAVYPDIQPLMQTKWYGKIATGYLIQRLGLQGFRIGNAQVSPKHALFIVNLGDAKAKDVLAIIDTIQEKCIQTFGFALDPEVEIVR